jgi:hypothetical protein
LVAEIRRLRKWGQQATERINKLEGKVDSRQMDQDTGEKGRTEGQMDSMKRKRKTMVKGESDRSEEGEMEKDNSDEIWSSGGNESERGKKGRRRKHYKESNKVRTTGTNVLRKQLSLVKKQLEREAQRTRELTRRLNTQNLRGWTGNKMDLEDLIDVPSSSADLGQESTACGAGKGWALE